MRISDWSSDVCSSDLVEIAFEPMANRFMEQYAGPSGAEQHGHLARRGVDRAQIDERLVQRLVDCAVPLRLLEQMIVHIATAEAEIARFAAAILLDHDRDVEADERADIGRSEEHTSELQSLMRTSYAVFCLKKK